jgi:PAS domain S-box-containing protein
MQHRERSALLDLAHDSIIVTSSNGTIEFWNRGAEKLYGYTRQEAMGSVSYDLLRTQLPEPLDAIQQKLMSQSVWQGELVHSHRDGHPIVVSSRWALRRDSNGRPNGFLEINRDITERKQAEEERRTLVALVEKSTDFIAMASTDGRVLFVNRAGQEMVGLEGDEQVRGTTVSDYHLPQDRERCRDEVFPALFRDGRWEGEAQFRHFKTGAPIPMQQHIFLMQDPGGERGTTLATICRDITAPQRAEAALRESEERFRNMADTAPVMIWISDENKLCTFFDSSEKSVGEFWLGQFAK